MNYTTDKQALGDLIGVNFEPGENIKLICYPHIKSFYLNQIRQILIILSFCLIISVIILTTAYYHNEDLKGQSLVQIFVIIVLFFGGSSIWSTRKTRKTTYIITDLSIIIYKDPRNPKTIVINRCDIQSKELTKTFIDKRMGTGTIQIFTGEMKNNDGTPEKVYDYIHAVTEPEKVFALV